jgi:hypothetical protein
MKACSKTAMFGMFLQVRALAGTGSFQFSRQQKKAGNFAGDVLQRKRRG